jgi:hypothetical protein
MLTRVKVCVMANLTVVIPDSLASILDNTVARRATSPDSVVTAALSQHFQTGRHRAYQISTSAALVQGVPVGADFKVPFDLWSACFPKASVRCCSLGKGTFDAEQRKK